MTRADMGARQHADQRMFSGFQAVGKRFGAPRTGELPLRKRAASASPVRLQPGHVPGSPRGSALFQRLWGQASGAARIPAEAGSDSLKRSAFHTNRAFPKHFPTVSGFQAALTVILIFLLTSCGALLGQPVSKEPRREIRSPASIHVGFISATASLNFAQEMAAGARYAANQYHVAAQIVAPFIFNDPEELKQFDELVKTARDGIAVETLAPELFTRSEARAVSTGIPLIAVDTVPLPGSRITTYVGNDNLAAGKMLADAAIQLIPTNAMGHVLVGIDNFGAGVLRSRARGIQQEFRQKRPALQVENPFDTRQPPQENLANWTRIITSYSAVIACLGTGDADNASLARIKQERHGTYLSGAFDLDPTALQAIANGTNFALIDPEHFLKGYVAMRLLIEHALYSSAIPQGWWNTGVLVVNQQNVQQIIRRQMSLAMKGRFYEALIEQEFANPEAQVRPLNQVT